MTEVEALAKIATAIEHLAVAVAGIGTVAWLTFFFKNQSPSAALDRLTTVITRWLARRENADPERERSRLTGRP